MAIRLPLAGCSYSEVHHVHHFRLIGNLHLLGEGEQSSVIMKWYLERAVAGPYVSIPRLRKLAGCTGLLMYP